MNWRSQIKPRLAAFLIPHCLACYASFILTVILARLTVPHEEIPWLAVLVYGLGAPILMPWDAIQMLPLLTSNQELLRYSIFAVIVYFAAFIIVFVHLWRRRMKAALLASGLCPVCGYDLRATPNRCPECGSVPPKKTPQDKICETPNKLSPEHQDNQPPMNTDKSN